MPDPMIAPMSAQNASPQSLQQNPPAAPAVQPQPNPPNPQPQQAQASAPQPEQQQAPAPQPQANAQPADPYAQFNPQAPEQAATAAKGAPDPYAMFSPEAPKTGLAAHTLPNGKIDWDAEAKDLQEMGKNRDIWQDTKNAASQIGSDAYDMTIGPVEKVGDLARNPDKIFKGSPSEIADNLLNLGIAFIPGGAVEKQAIEHTAIAKALEERIAKMGNRAADNKGFTVPTEGAADAMKNSELPIQQAKPGAEPSLEAQQGKEYWDKQTVQQLEDTNKQIEYLQKRNSPADVDRITKLNEEAEALHSRLQGKAPEGSAEAMANAQSQSESQMKQAFNPKVPEEQPGHPLRNAMAEDATASTAKSSASKDLASEAGVDYKAALSDTTPFSQGTSQKIAKLLRYNPGKDATEIVKAAEDPVTEALGKWEKAGLHDQPVTLNTFNNIDQKLGDIISADYKAHGKLSDVGQRAFDKQTELRKMVQGEPGTGQLAQGRQKWSQAAKLRDVEKIVNVSKDMKNASTALETRMNTYLNSAKARGWSEDEVAAARNVVNKSIKEHALHYAGNGAVPYLVGALGEVLTGGTTMGTAGSLAAGLASKAGSVGLKNLQFGSKMNKVDALKDTIVKNATKPKGLLKDKLD